MGKIKVRGAREHNLKDINVDIPKNKLVVITGLSGSGKSSLAFDTLYAEGQRRYVESLSSYARQFLNLMPKPDVDGIEGLSPAISIEQKTVSKNPRSTVGTITEIYDYFRLLFARIGVPYSPTTGLPIRAQTVSQIVDSIMDMKSGTKLYILSPIVRSRKGEHKAELLQLKRLGFERVFINDKLYSVDEAPDLAKQIKHDISIVVDRIVVSHVDAIELQKRIANSVEIALRHSDGLLIARNSETGEQSIFSQKFACPVSGFCIEEIEPRLFSFNSPKGACSECGGLGYYQYSSMIFPKSVAFALDENSEIMDFSFFNERETCKKCNGTRLCEEALSVKINGANIAEVSCMSITDCLAWFNSLWSTMSEKDKTISEKIVHEIINRLGFLVNVGLEYLTISRPAETLSGGEGQRIRLASQIGSGLTGVMYVLDEPSIGLHQRDNGRLISTLQKLKSYGNTVIVVEHDAETMEAADWILDLGPKAGIHGGQVIASGTIDEIKANKDSITGQYLSGVMSIPVPGTRRRVNLNKSINLLGASGNNLKGIDVKFPLGVLTCVTGVSGSGKSTLVIDTLFKSAYNKVSAHKKVEIKNLKAIQGLEYIDKVVDINQAPIGRTPRSNPATYVGCFTDIRNLFATMPEARANGYTSSRFSFNVKGGRCEACKGDGVIKIEMHFLPDVYVVCDQCKGSRYNRETLDVKFRGKNIADVLDMTIEDGSNLFKNQPAICDKLLSLCRVGLGYLNLGHKATLLSGGEAQRVKLAKELARRSTGNTLYILDEPTTGLHAYDVKKLLEILYVLVDQGNTVVVIEHNMDVIKTADWIIDVGKDGGEHGGEIVATGTPEDVAACDESYTGAYLRRLPDIQQNS